MILIELYLLAFDALRSEHATEELHTLVNTMVERGLRMRQDLEEDVVMRVAQGDKREDDEGDLEIEENAQELRRLMPY